MTLLTGRVQRYIEGAVHMCVERAALDYDRGPTIGELTRAISQVLRGVFAQKMKTSSKARGLLAGAVVYEQERVRALQAALKTFGDHSDSMCYARDRRPDGTCDCGFERAYKDLT